MGMIGLTEDLKVEVRNYYIKTEDSRLESIDFLNFNDDISDTKERMVTETLF